MSTSTESPTTTEPELGSDGKVFDPERSAHTIRNLRAIEGDLTKENRWLRDSLKAVVGGRPLTPEQQAGIEYVTPTQAVISSVYEETLRSVGKLLGLTDEAITAPGGSDALLAAARSAALAGPLGDAITRANADPGLTRKVVDVASIDVGVDAGTLEAALDEAVADAVKAYPAIKRPTYPDRSGASFPAGSSQSEILTRDVIAQMTPEAVNQARKAGMIPGFAADAS
jgi:hypothetical protein